MLAAAFHWPSFCFFQIVVYLPYSSSPAPLRKKAGATNFGNIGRNFGFELKDFRAAVGLSFRRVELRFSSV